MDAKLADARRCTEVANPPDPRCETATSILRSVGTEGALEIRRALDTLISFRAIFYGRNEQTGGPPTVAIPDVERALRPWMAPAPFTEDRALCLADDLAQAADFDVRLLWRGPSLAAVSGG